MAGIKFHVGAAAPCRWVRGLGRTRRGKVLLSVITLLLLVGTGAGVVLVLWTLPVVRGHLASVLNPTSARGLIYFHDAERSVPWSMHVVKISRAHRELELHAIMGQGRTLGMMTVSNLTKQVPSEWGRPVAAVNGDLYNNHPDYPGDPEGLQIAHGELVSAPSEHRACFWVDPAGELHRGDVRSQFQVAWPDGTSVPFGLNEARTNGAAVLYTAATGSSTRTKAGTEYVLRPAAGSPWMPLQVGKTYTAQVREVRSAGDTALQADAPVLSLDPALAARLPALSEGAVLRLSTATLPELHGVLVALGGGPSLVVGGRPQAWHGVRLRHPRTAIGWNRDYIYLVVVDGRQLSLSLGMTLPELSDYMVKLGCEEAINLDGGGSTTCVAYGNVMNSPSQGRERPAANALVVVQKRTP